MGGEYNNHRQTREKGTRKSQEHSGLARKLQFEDTCVQNHKIRAGQHQSSLYSGSILRSATYSLLSQTIFKVSLLDWREGPWVLSN